MKTLVVYYSLTGNTKKMAEIIAKNLHADIEEIADSISREGLWRKILSGLESVCKKSTIIGPIKLNPADYDLVILGTPVWASNMACAVRAWLLQYRPSLKRIAFFATLGGRGDINTFKDMALLAKKQPIATVALTNKEIMTDEYQSKLNDFLNQLIVK